MVLKGQVRNGAVVLDQPGALPEGAVGRVEVLTESAGVRELREGLLRLAGTVQGLPADMARNHDHYLHGAPRK